MFQNRAVCADFMQ